MTNIWDDPPSFTNQELVTATKLNYLVNDLLHLGGLVLADGVTQLKDADTGGRISTPVPNPIFGHGGNTSSAYYLGMGTISSAGVQYCHLVHPIEAVPSEAYIWYKSSVTLSANVMSLELRYHQTGTNPTSNVSTLNTSISGSTANYIYRKNIVSLYGSVSEGDLCNLRVTSTFTGSPTIEILGVELKFL